MTVTIQSIPAEDTYPLRRKILWPDGPDALIILDDDHLPTTQHFGLFDAKQQIGVVSLFEHDGTMQFRKLAIDRAFQNQGHGTALLSHVIDIARAANTSRLWCNARVSAFPFYEKLGFSTEPTSFFKKSEEYRIAYIEFGPPS